jgi:hypothetical protein
MTSSELALSGREDVYEFDTVHGFRFIHRRKGKGPRNARTEGGGVGKKEEGRNDINIYLYISLR